MTIAPPAAGALAPLLLGATSRTRLYGPEHGLARKATLDLLGRLEEGLAQRDRVVLVLRGDELEIDGEPLPGGDGAAGTLARQLAARGLGRIEFTAGLDAAELGEFCTAWEAPRRVPLRSSPHVVLSESRVAAPDESRGAGLEAIRELRPAREKGGAPTPEGERFAELVSRAREHREVRVGAFEELAFGFLAGFARRRNLLAHLSELKGHSGFTWLHAANVTQLSIGFALSLGVERRQVHRIGLAALLHDIGKTAIPEEILAKNGLPTATEWETIRRHPQLGARLLAREKRVPRLAIVVAFEHHLHADGRGGYPRTAAGAVPCLAAQLVSIADTFDALFGNRSYHRKYDLLEALALIDEQRGTAYNPWLVDTFSRWITTETEGEAN